MMNMLRKSLAIEIDNFVNFMQRDLIKQKSFSKSAFVQSRMKIIPEVFKQLSELLIQEFYTDNDLSVKLWKGFRLLAIDGSHINLPMTKELKTIYGLSKNQTKTAVVQARCSIMYDVENKYVLDGILAPLKQGEKGLAESHLEHCQANDLLIYDRNYPSYDFIYLHIDKGLDYLMRSKISFNQATTDFHASGKTSLIVDFYPRKKAKTSDKPYEKDTPIKVRLIRVELPKGEVEILITSLLDSEQYPTKLFKKLYFKRWDIETFYDELKNKLKVEHFSGYSNQSILQDFYAALFVSNVQTLIVSELEEEIAVQDQTKKLNYKVNSNLSYGFLKNRILKLFLTEDSMESATLELKALFKKHLVPIRPNRSYERNTSKNRSRRKHKVAKNQKDTL